jgi:hypothetical protein
MWMFCWMCEFVRPRVGASWWISYFHVNVLLNEWVCKSRGLGVELRFQVFMWMFCWMCAFVRAEGKGVEFRIQIFMSLLCWMCEFVRAEGRGRVDEFQIFMWIFCWMCEFVRPRVGGSWWILDFHVNILLNVWVCESRGWGGVDEL